MEQIKSQRRMLIGVALLSFGSLCGALTVFRLSASAVSVLSASISSFFLSNPILLITSAALLVPVLMLISAASLFGFIIVCGLFILCGFFGGAFGFLAMQNRFYPQITVLYLLLSSFCIIQIGGCTLRLSFSLRRQAVCSGLSKPDHGYNLPRIAAAFIVLLLASSAFALFIRSM